MLGRVLILGSTDFTLAIADAVRAAGSDVAAIVHVAETFEISYAAQPVKNFRAADIAGWCAANGAQAIAFDTYASLKPVVAALQPDLCLLAGWYHMVPRSVRTMFPKGCAAFHASLLPQLRGGAPLNWAILAGLKETGVTLFEVGDGVDDGAVHDQLRISIGDDTCIADLVSAASTASAEMVARSLPGMLAGTHQPCPQSGVASYGLQRTPEDGRIDWRRPAADIARLVRAVSRPYPGAFTRLEGREMMVHTAHPYSDTLVFGAPGQIITIQESAHPLVVCGEGSLAILEAFFETGEDALPTLRAASHKRLGS